MDLLEKIYYDPSKGLQSKKRLYEAVKDKGITMKQVDEFLKNQETYQIQKKPHLPKHYIPIISKEPNEIQQADLLDVSSLSTYNTNYKFILIVIDIFTRKVFVKPLKNKTGSEVLKSFEEVINETNPKIIQADQGSEFINNSFKNLLKSKNIELQLIQVGDHNKLGIVNRFCRTIREMMNKYTTAYKTNKYIDVLQDLIKNYNNTIHSTIGMSPNDAHKHKKDIQKLNTVRYNEAIKEEQHFKIGDRVRCVVNLSAFEKRSLPRWSSTVHTIESKTEHSYTLDHGKTYKQNKM